MGKGGAAAARRTGSDVTKGGSVVRGAGRADGRVSRSSTVGLCKPA
jgi:hypothetical protein